MESGVVMKEHLSNLQGLTQDKIQLTRQPSVRKSYTDNLKPQPDM